MGIYSLVELLDNHNRLTHAANRKANQMKGDNVNIDLKKR